MTDEEALTILEMLADTGRAIDGLLFTERHACRHIAKILHGLRAELKETLAILADKVEDTAHLRHFAARCRVEGEAAGVVKGRVQMRGEAVAAVRGIQVTHGHAPMQIEVMRAVVIGAIAALPDAPPAKVEGGGA